MTGINTEYSQHQIHTDGIMSKASAFVNRLTAPKPTPFWLKIDNAINQEDVIIKNAFQENRRISTEEHQQIMKIRKERNGFVFKKFLGNRDPRKDYGNTQFPHESGGCVAMPLDTVKNEIVRRTKYRDTHPAVPGYDGKVNPKLRELEIRLEKEDLEKVIQYWAKTKYRLGEQVANDNYVAIRKKDTIGMEIWNALVFHDTLTETCFKCVDGTQSMSTSERDTIKDNIDELKFLVRILTIEPT